MKLPVFRAIGDTFVFVGRNWLPILQIIWLPTLVFFAAYVAVMPAYTDASMAMGTIDPTDAQAMGAAFSGWLVWLGVFTAMMIGFNLIFACGVLKLVVRGEKPRLPGYFAFGMDELRVGAAWLLNFAVYCGVGLLAALGVMLGRWLASSGPGPAGFVINLLVVLGVIIAGVYLSLRLSLAAPASIDQRKIGVAASWRTAEDNLGEIFGFWALWSLMLGVIYFIAGFLSVPPEYFEATREAATGTPEAMARLNEMTKAMYDFSSVPNTIRLAIAFLVMPVMFVFIAVAGGMAWRHLHGVSEPAPAAEPPPA